MKLLERSPGRAVDYDYPIEQLARSTNTRFQMGFARMTMHLAPDFREVAFEPCAEGLKILAAHELALSVPGEVIREIHGHNVEIGTPQARLIYGDPIQEPIMWVRAVAARAFTEAVLHDLILRNAEIDEVDWLAPSPTVRAKAPLRQLIGYPQAFAELAGERADLRMWLSHYAPLRPGPENAA